MATLDDEILINDLEENLADDPYGTASYVIRNTIHRALKLQGMMSDVECKTLINLDEQLRVRENS
jgi:hypothetical protein